MNRERHQFRSEPTESTPSVPLVAFVPFFSDPDRAAQFRAIGKTWYHTPFREHSRAKGPDGGIDCAGFLEEWFFEAGAAPRFNFPRSDGDYRSHVHNTKIISFLKGVYKPPGSDTIDQQSEVLASLFVKLTNLDELVPVPSWPANPVRNTGLMTGDITIIKAKIPGVWHLPAMLDDRMFLHCAFPDGVAEGDITQADIRSRLVAVFRRRA